MARSLSKVRGAGRGAPALCGGGGSGALQRADVYASFGGLLMQLTGEPKRLEDLDIDQNIYLLMRKVT